MSLVQQFLKSFRESDDLEVGIFMKNDGTVWLRNPDGSETQLPGGGGSSSGFAAFAASFQPQQAGMPLMGQKATFPCTGVGAGTGGFQTAFATPPGLVASDGVVWNSPVVEVSGLPVTDNGNTFALIAKLIASNQDGTEVLVVSDGQDAIVPPSGVIDWSVGSVEFTVGADLAWDSGSQSIVSAGGGVFTVAMVASGTWD